MDIKENTKIPSKKIFEERKKKQTHILAYIAREEEWKTHMHLLAFGLKI